MKNLLQLFKAGASVTALGLTMMLFSIWKMLCVLFILFWHYFEYPAIAIAVLLVIRAVYTHDAGGFPQ